MSKILLSSAFFLLALLPLAAQPLAGSSNQEQLLFAADSARATYNWSVALDTYQELYDMDKEDNEYVLPLIAEMNYQLRDVAAGIRGYTRAFRKTEPTDTSINIHRFYYGRLLKMDEQYDEARTYLENFLQYNQDTTLDYLARMELEGIELYRDAPRETGRGGTRAARP